MQQLAEPYEGRAVHPDQPVHAPQMTELGVSGGSDYAGVALDEYLGTLKGHQGIRMYDKMRRSDAQVRGTLRLVKTPITAAEWFVQPASNNQLDKDAADFIQWNLFESMHHTWNRFLWEALNMLDFGYYPFEQVWEWGYWAPNRDRARRREVLYLSKLAPRHPITIYEWKYDNHGEPIAMVQSAWSNLGSAEVTIPWEKLIVFTLDEEGNNPEGISILRSAYKHWYYKDNLYKVDAIAKERHGIGIPKVHLPEGYNDSDVQKAEEMGSNLRTNEKSYITLPPRWDVSFLEIKTNPVDALKSAEHHDLMIARNVLGQFMNLGSTTSGSRALGGSQQEIFVKAVRYISAIISQQINTYIIPRLVDWNFNGISRYPKLKVRRIGETVDWRGLSVAIRNLVEPGVITPTGELESYISEMMDLPLPTEEAMARGTTDRINKDKPVQPLPDQNQGADGLSSEQRTRQSGGDAEQPTE